MALSAQMLATLQDLINVASSTGARSVTGAITYATARAVYARVERDTERENLGAGEDRATRYKLVVAEEILYSDRIWLPEDAQTDPTSSAPTVGKHRMAKRIATGRGPGTSGISHWEVEV